MVKIVATTSLPVDRLTATDCNAAARAKTYFAKVVRSGHITIDKWSRIFDLGGLRLVCPPPKGEGKQKVARIKKLI